MKKLLLTVTAIAAAGLGLIVWKEAFEDQRWSFAGLLLASALGTITLAGIGSFLAFDRHGSSVGKMWLLAFSSILSYVIVDFAAGQILLQRLAPYTVPDELTHHSLIPNTYSHVRTREFRYNMRVNNLGMRGPDVEAAKSDETFRILMLGDSFTMGKGVKYDKSFSFLVEDSLNATATKMPVSATATATAAKKIEVLNGGVDSYAPILSYMQLSKNLGPLLDLDMVVLNFDMSDLMQEHAYRRSAITNSAGEITGFPPRDRDVELFEDARRFIEGNLYISRLLLAYVELADAVDGSNAVRQVVNLANPVLLKHTLASDDDARDEEWNAVFDSISRIRDYCTSRGIEFLLTTYPWGHQVNDREWVPGRDQFVPDRDARVSDKSMDRLKDFADQNGIAFLDATPAFRSYAGPDPLYFRIDMHWTPEGHKVMASVLTRCIKALMDPSEARAECTSGQPTTN